MGRVRAVVCVVCLLGTVTPAVADVVPHVRGVGSYGAWLVKTGSEVSGTVRELVERLDRSDVIAYVRVVPLSRVLANTVLLNGEGPVRYLLISVDHGRAPDVLIEMLGHELQHAVEIAEARNVRDETGMIALYRRIGLHTGSGRTEFETVLAREMGRRARHDLLRRPAALYAPLER